MATIEISEYVKPPLANGTSLALRPLPLKHSQKNSGDVFIPDAKTLFITILPSADVRMNFTTDGQSDPSDPTGVGSCKLYSAGVERELWFDTPPSKLRFKFA